MEFLLTGGTGFFGKSLLRYWLQTAIHGEQPPLVTVLSRSPESFIERYPEFSRQNWLRFHRGDILEPSTLPVYSGFTHILHAATDSTVGPGLSPLERYTQIVEGTRHLLDYAATHHISRFLLTSSGGVYGPQPLDMDTIPETYNGMPDPLNAQKENKRTPTLFCLFPHPSVSFPSTFANPGSLP